MFYFGLAKVRRFIIFHSVFNKGIHRENIGEYPKAMSYLYLALSLMPRSIKTYIAIARVNLIPSFISLVVVIYVIIPSGKLCKIITNIVIIPKW